MKVTSWVTSDVSEAQKKESAYGNQKTSTVEPVVNVA